MLAGPTEPDPGRAARSLRLFTALWPADDERACLARWAGQWQWPPSARRVPPAKLHLTLHFLGAVPADHLPALLHGLPPAPPPFRLAFGEAGAWAGGLVVLHPLALPEPLLALHAAQRQALRALGLPVEARPYRPHVTLARRAAGAVPPAAPLRAHWAVYGHVLVQSSAGEAGGGYQVLARY
ncbi:MAG: RNA 2',3'-cyclic phosphodiesterase [Burkholderiales bacterium]|nr:RNA 2',3'-cyclic phosphodiesterase [Burkholderiales bacterium]